jgi:hypothetical protein
MSDRSEAFERAFVAASYLVGRRGADLLEPLPRPCAATQKLVARLGHAEQAVRAQVLADELAPIVKALEAWKYQ